jgi:hypothetical protein
MKFEIIRNRKRKIENDLADFKKVQYFSQESNRPPCNRFLSRSFIQWVYSITYYGPVSESMIEGNFINDGPARGEFYLSNYDLKAIAKSQRES